MHRSITIYALVAVSSLLAHAEEPQVPSAIPNEGDRHFDAKGNMRPLAWIGPFVVILNGADGLLTPNKLADAPFVVCSDRIVRLAATGVPAGAGVPSAYGAQAFYYELPCAAQLVLGAEVPGIVLGKRSPPQRESLPVVELRLPSSATAPIKIHGQPGTVHRCTIDFPGEKPLRVSFRNCEVQFAGDLNGDGIDDVVIDGRGEMGCGGLSLYNSSPHGWALAGSHYDNC